MEDEALAILKSARTVAVVGLSADPSRPSHMVASYLKRQGYRIIPVNPNATEVLGEKSYPDLRSVPERIDVVDVFRRPEHVPGVVEEAIAVGAKALWLQEESSTLRLPNGPARRGCGWSWTAAC